MGFLAPVLLSFVWMGVLRYFTGVFAYLIILMTNVGAIGVTLYLYVKAGVIGSDEITAYAGEAAAATTETTSTPRRITRRCCCTARTRPRFWRRSCSSSL